MVKTYRKLHLWLSLLFAPSLIFFSISGALMMFGLHESGGALGKLAEVHKVQSIDERPARASKRPPASSPAAVTMEPQVVSDAAPAAPAAAPARAPLHRSWPLMVWFAALALGLVASAVFGVYLAFAYKRDRATVLGLLAAGIVIPVVFAFL